MRVDGITTYDISQGHSVDFQGMTEDGETVYFSSADQITPDDEDSSTDLYMWSEATDEITRISVGSEGSIGNTDECSATWIANAAFL